MLGDKSVWVVGAALLFGAGCKGNNSADGTAAASASATGGAAGTASPSGSVATTASAAVKAAATTAASAAPKATVGAPEGMIRIKGGEFKMGSEDGEADEKPVHTATVATFDLDATEVTVAAYKACVQSKDCTDPNPGEWSTYYESDPTRPVNYVDLKQSQTYCAKQGKRLPTEEEWEFAARGPKGRTWAWGDTPPVMGDGCWGRLAWLKKEGPCPVGAFPKSDTPDGVHDMSGNLWEWTSSGYSFVYEKPRDTSRGLYRGGSWKDLDAKGTKKDPVLVERAARRWRNMPTVKGPMVGFRCAKDVTG